jgi:hypothetical protein
MGCASESFGESRPVGAVRIHHVDFEVSVVIRAKYDLVVNGAVVGVHGGARSGTKDARVFAATNVHAGDGVFVVLRRGEKYLLGCLSLQATLALIAKLYAG